jgi:hypothetical protein
VASSRKPPLITIPRIALALALAWVAARYFPIQNLFRSNTSHFVFQARHIPAPDLSSPFGHPYYRYSVIPGGAYSRVELERALSNDSVAAAHYTGFRTQDARIISLEEDRHCYLSYRVGDRVYWTRRLVKLTKGEKLLTDGVHYARARCGNRLQDQPAHESAAVEPDEKAFSAPVPVDVKTEQHTDELDPAPELRFEISTTRIAGLPDSLASLAKPFVPDAPAYNEYVPPEHYKPPIFVEDGTRMISMLPLFAPANVPEPSTAAMTMTALLGFALAFVGVRFKANRQTRSETR